MLLIVCNQPILQEEISGSFAAITGPVTGLTVSVAPDYWRAVGISNLSDSIGPQDTVQIDVRTKAAVSFLKVFQLVQEAPNKVNLIPLQQMSNKGT
jgi:hypothetical protein